MDSRSIADNTTVVGGPLSTIGDNDRVDPKITKATPRYGQPSSHNTASRPIADTPDYMETDRPFFIKIGKDGLNAALQKLDKQLQNVRLFTPLFLNFC